MTIAGGKIAITGAARGLGKALDRLEAVQSTIA